MLENKKKILILCILIFVCGIVTILNKLIQVNSKKNNIKESILVIVDNYYQNYLYKKGYSLIEKAATDGKKIVYSVGNFLQAFNNFDVDNIQDTAIYKMCNLEESMIEITPHLPISPENYDVFLVLKC